MILLLDNYDSFTYNIYQYLCELGVAVIIKRNDQISIDEIKTLPLSHLVISPGPGNPDNVGFVLDVIKYFINKIPILGICLGHQAIARIFGSLIVRSRRIMHGKISIISHNQQGVFSGLKNNFYAIRYNSLTVDIKSLPSVLEITSVSKYDDNISEIMSIRHKFFPVEGVQFHPESILTEEGHKLLKNFLKY
uniref:Aminodeoxychorismate synthase component 2 n=1 Tax=Candidatus Aschnera chinzeii TaxID=1485666 RepID=A0AAT9G4R8_9ENTR|nr:MAG: aminodeoxychorismate synthase component II [Candidatus Aschnera chinzeii]